MSLLRPGVVKQHKLNPTLEFFFNFLHFDKRSKAYKAILYQNYKVDVLCTFPIHVRYENADQTPVTSNF